MLVGSRRENHLESLFFLMDVDEVGYCQDLRQLNGTSYIGWNGDVRPRRSAFESRASAFSGRMSTTQYTKIVTLAQDKLETNGNATNRNNATNCSINSHTYI